MFKRYKKTVLALTLAVAVGLSSVTARVLSIPALSPVKEAHAILGGAGGGIMQMLPMLLMMMMLSSMLTQQQYDRQINASGNLLNVGNNPQNGGNTAPNQNPNTTTSTLPQQQLPQPQQQPSVVIRPSTDGNNLQIAVVPNPSSVNPNPASPSTVNPQPAKPGGAWSLVNSN